MFFFVFETLHYPYRKSIRPSYADTRIILPAWYMLFCNIKISGLPLCDKLTKLTLRNSIYRAYSDFTNCPYQTMHRFVCTQSLFINHKQFTIYPIVLNTILWLVMRGYIISCFAYICIIRQENFDVNSFCLSGRIFAPAVKIWQKITLILFWIRVILNCVFVQLNTFYRL